MAVRNELDRFHPMADVIDRLSKLGARAADAKQAIRDKLVEHELYICEHGDDVPEIRGWQWGREAAANTSEPLDRRHQPHQRPGRHAVHQPADLHRRGLQSASLYLPELDSELGTPAVDRVYARCGPDGHAKNERH